jgi:DNA repair photolyase
VIVQTRSPLVLRDIDVFQQSERIEVGLSITTANDAIRKAFEPHAPSIEARLKAIESLRQNGIKTYAMIAPILPEAENLVAMLEGKVDYIIIDRMNYRHSDAVYRQHGWQANNTNQYFDQVKRKMPDDCAQFGSACRAAY